MNVAVTKITMTKDALMKHLGLDPHDIASHTFWQNLVSDPKAKLD